MRKYAENPVSRMTSSSMCRRSRTSLVTASRVALAHPHLAELAQVGVGVEPSGMGEYVGRRLRPRGISTWQPIRDRDRV